VISSLTDQQTNDLSRLKKVWLTAFLQPSEGDRISAASAIVKQYDALSSTYSPRILFAEGPRSARDLLGKMVGMHGNPFTNDFPEIPFGAYRDARNIGDEIFLAHVKEANKIKQEFNQTFSKEVAGSLRNMVLYDLNHHMISQVVQPILKSLEISQPEHLSGFRFRPSLYPSILDADWTMFYELCNICIGTSLISNSVAKEFIDAGGFLAYTYDSFALAIPGPKKILVDAMGRLHCENGPAVKWADGTCIYFWNGVEVPETLLENPEKISREAILNEKNAEVRRCYLEILGSEQFGALLGLQLLDHSKDRFGNDLKLFRTKDRDKVAGDFIYFGAVVCPSTLRSYFLCVPPHIKTAVEAVSWTFGKTPENYNPIIET
jgi:hypothetical protein